MTTFSNELPASFVVYNPKIPVNISSSPVIDIHTITSPQIKWQVLKSTGIPYLKKVNSLTVLTISKGTSIAEWEFKSILLVRIQDNSDESIATSWLEGVLEYGTGKGHQEAIEDLVVSLGEYLESLEKQYAILGDSARRELDTLRKLIERKLPATS